MSQVLDREKAKKALKNFYWELGLMITFIQFYLLFTTEFLTGFFNVHLDSIAASPATRFAFVFKPTVMVIFVVFDAVIIFGALRSLRPLKKFLHENVNYEKARLSAVKLNSWIFLINFVIWIVALTAYYWIKDFNTESGIPYHWSMIIKLSGAMSGSVGMVLFASHRLAKIKEYLNMTDIRDHERDLFSEYRDFLLVVPGFLFMFAILGYVVFYYHHSAGSNLSSGMVLLSYFVVISMAIVTSFLYPYFSQREQSVQIKTLQNSFKALLDGNGDLSKRIKLINFNEIGELAVSMNLFLEKLNGEMLELKSAAEQTAELSTQVSESSENIALSSEQQSLRVDNMNRAFQDFTEKLNSLLESALQESIVLKQAHSDIERLSEGIQKMSERFGTIQNHTHESITQAEETVSQVDTVTQNALSMKENMSEIQSTVHSAAEQTKDIDQILRVIEDIADNTSILSMNAAIEAAHAGEAGKGFAIVASEVRSLADMSAKSALDIKARLNKIRDTIETAEKAVTIGSKKSEENQILSAQTVQYAQQISSTSQDVADLVTKMTGEVHDQQKSTEDFIRVTNEMLHFLDSVSETIQNQYALAENIQEDISGIAESFKHSSQSAHLLSDTASNLEQTGENLEKIVGHFRISEIRDSNLSKNSSSDETSF